MAQRSTNVRERHARRSQDNDHADGATQQPAQGRSRKGRSYAGAGAEPASHKERRLLQHGRSTLTGGAGPSLTTKSGSIFVFCADDGDIDTERHEGYGLYFHDTRFLDTATLRVEAQRLTVLLGSDERGDRSVCELTNADIALPGGKTLGKETLGVSRTRKLGATVTETVAVHNFGREAVRLTLVLRYASRFTNMFVVRGAAEEQRGTLHEPRWQGDTLVLRYDGADDRTRTTRISFDPLPDQRSGGEATFELQLAPGRELTLTATIDVRDDGSGNLEPQPSPEAAVAPFQGVSVESDNPLFDRTLARCFESLRMLAMREHGDSFFAAGVPWYVALFGRDSIITALQTLAFDGEIAQNTLRVLARYQGTQHDAWRDEEPGKILHELRVGEKAHLHEVPQTPYYGTVDATPLFIVLLAEYVRWTGETALWRELQENVQRALQWIDECGDHDGDGFVDYESQSGKGLSNQGWKDSGNSITNRDGSLAQPPIALVEVQGYVYLAKLSAAYLHDLDGDHGTAERLRGEADELKRRFHEAYWVRDRDYLAVALQRGGRQADAITSNPGQALWTGIVADGHARAVAKMLLSEAMFSGWGIRTLAEGEAAYNPIDYQVGSIWPHDNALIAAGLKRYGFEEEFEQVFSAIFQAATHFDHYQLPEVFAGFSRRQYSQPVHYPVACSPQAWASGALPLLLTTALGLQPDAPAKRLHVVRPALPAWLGSLRIRGVRVGEGTVDLHYRRSADGTLVAVLKKQGNVQVSVEY